MNICETCIYDNNCAAQRDKKHPIWECSDFSTFQEEVGVLFSPTVYGVPPVDNTDNSIKGLCQNCELRNACTWLRQDIVIFHCEHYQ